MSLLCVLELRGCVGVRVCDVWCVCSVMCDVWMRTHKRLKSHVWTSACSGILLHLSSSLPLSPRHEHKQDKFYSSYVEMKASHHKNKHPERERENTESNKGGQNRGHSHHLMHTHTSFPLCFSVLARCLCVSP